MYMEFSKKHGFECSGWAKTKLVWRKGRYCIVKKLRSSGVEYQLGILLRTSEALDGRRKNPRTNRRWPWDCKILAIVRTNKNWREIVKDMIAAAEAAEASKKAMDKVKAHDPPRCHWELDPRNPNNSKRS